MSGRVKVVAGRLHSRRRHCHRLRSEGGGSGKSGVGYKHSAGGDVEGGYCAVISGGAKWLVLGLGALASETVVQTGEKAAETNRGGVGTQDTEARQSFISRPMLLILVPISDWTTKKLTLDQAGKES